MYSNEISPHSIFIDVTIKIIETTILGEGKVVVYMGKVEVRKRKEETMSCVNLKKQKLITERTKIYNLIHYPAMEMINSYSV